jgi:hypothetical protein
MTPRFRWKGRGIRLRYDFYASVAPIFDLAWDLVVGLSKLRAWLKGDTHQPGKEVGFPVTRSQGT